MATKFKFTYTIEIETDVLGLFGDFDEEVVYSMKIIQAQRGYQVPDVKIVGVSFERIKDE